jgi:thioredoxin 1
MPAYFHPTITAVVFILAVPTLTGCDKLKTAVSKLSKAKQTESSAPTALGPARSDQMSEIDQAGYPGFIARRNALAIVDFTATWCGPCKMLAPVLEKATAAHPGVVYIGKVDVDKNPELAKAQGVSGIPDVRIFRDGKEVGRFVGFPGEQAVLEKVATLSKGIQPVASEAAPATPKPIITPASKDWIPQGMQRR